MWQDLRAFLQNSFRNKAQRRKFILRRRLFNLQETDRRDAIRHDTIRNMLIVRGSRISREGVLR